MVLKKDKKVMWMKKRLRVAIVFIVLIVVGSIAGVFIFEKYRTREERIISASGTFEAHEITLSAKSTGQIIELPVEEGITVSSGQMIAVIDDAVYKNQVDLAMTAIELANKQVDLAVFNYDQRVSIAEANLESSLVSRDDMMKYNHYVYYDQPLSVTSSKQSTKTEVAPSVFQKTSINTTSYTYPGESQKVSVRAQLDQAISAYKIAAVNLQYAKESGIEVELAEIALKQAELGLKSAEIALNNCTIVTPVSGVVLVKMAEVGEFAITGIPLVKVGQLDEMELVIYVPEDRLGFVKLNQGVDIYVDSFEGEIFRGKVTKIADQAEFTPTNIQTKEKRVTTVYAVTIKVPNPDQKLKPGMPADAEINY
jgi:HlyD family secretion protein